MYKNPKILRPIVKHSKEKSSVSEYTESLNNQQYVTSIKNAVLTAAVKAINLIINLFILSKCCITSLAHKGIVIFVIG